MAWTSPRTYTTGEVITKAILDTHVRDNFNVTAPAVLTTQGDILYASGANAPARLAKSATATHYISNGGTNNNPLWAQINLANGVTGTLPVGNGGTGATTLTDGGVLLGSGSSAVTAMGVLSDGEMIVGDGSTDPVAESGATLRTSIGVGTGDSPQFTGIELGHASDTTIARSGSGDLTIEGNAIYRAGGTDVPVADGGTGASSLNDHYVLVGSGTAAVTPVTPSTAGLVLTSNGTGSDPSFQAAAGGKSMGFIFAMTK